jgi:hypothetical protein
MPRLGAWNVVRLRCPEIDRVAQDFDDEYSLLVGEPRADVADAAIARAPDEQGVDHLSAVRERVWKGVQTMA